MRALFLVGALAFAGITIVLLVSRKSRRASASAPSPSPRSSTTTPSPARGKVDTQIVYITPYVVTLLVLTFASQRLRPPAAEGKPWFKGQSE